jgi:hypothetical protein
LASKQFDKAIEAVYKTLPTCPEDVREKEFVERSL